VDVGAIVTGAAGNIGSAIVGRLLERRLGVLAVDRNAAGLEALCARYSSTQALVTVIGDVTDEATAEACARSAQARFGQLGYLVNNAGDHGPLARIDTVPVADFRRDLDVCLVSQFLFLRAVVPAMLQQQHGRVVNIASTIAQHAAAGLAGYCVAKSGVIALTKTAALEYARLGIRCNAVSPGMVPSPNGISRHVLDLQPGADVASRVAAAAATLPAGRAGRPEEVGAIVEWLLLDAPDYVNGAVISVDGADSTI
jgi:NAD(P)-dependent dehydrogenase (short-subunit alcohol dehydrogenase family)